MLSSVPRRCDMGWWPSPPSAPLWEGKTGYGLPSRCTTVLYVILWLVRRKTRPVSLPGSGVEGQQLSLWIVSSEVGYQVISNLHCVVYSRFVHQRSKGRDLAYFMVQVSNSFERVEILCDILYRHVTYIYTLLRANITVIKGSPLEYIHYYVPS